MTLTATLKRYILYALVMLFPLFFLPFSQEFYSTQKVYLLAFGGLALVLMSVIELLVNKKIVWNIKSLDAPVLLFVLGAALSILFSSQNKIQAVFNPTFGLVSIISLSLLYFYTSRQQKNTGTHFFSLLGISAWIAAIISIIFFFQPFKAVELPVALMFFKNPFFNTIGDQLSFIIFLLCCTAITGYEVAKSREQGENLKLNLFSMVLFIIALGLAIFSLASATSNFSAIVLPPLRISWYAAVETLKNPVTALFGVGIDNYSAIFTQVKDALYNQGSLSQISSFTVARSAILHIFTETGLFGFLSFVFIYFTAFASKEHRYKAHLMIVGALLVLFPPNLPLFFLLFLILGLIAQEQHNNHELDISHLPILAVILSLLGVAAIGSAGYFLTQSFIAEYHHKRAIDGLNGAQGINVYQEEQKALEHNGAMERYHVTFSSINMLLANNIAKKDPAKISADDRQIIAQAIQAAINEAKVAVSLNPQKATNWENLANIYRNILNVVQGADVWTVVAFQRAIITDPQNPNYRLGLGGVYYSLDKFDEAKNMFEQAVSLKPDWPNAYYNLAWASYQTEDYQLAANAMQNAIALLEKDKNSADYKKAVKELEDFKKKIPQEEVAAEGDTSTGTQLKLPDANKTATLEPKLKLPKEAEPDVTITPTPTEKVEETPSATPEPTATP